MRVSFLAAGLLAVGLSACSAVDTTSTGARAQGVASTAPGASSQMPQSPNSLPPGDTVNAPIDRSITLGRTRY